MSTECACEEGGTDETPMRLLEGEKSLLTVAVHASDTIEIDVDLSFGTELSDALRHAIRPFPDEFPFQDNLGSIA
jgi:hypothetical protein